MTKIVTCILHPDDLQGAHWYGMILGFYILLELNMELCFSDNNIMGNGGEYEGSDTPTKEVYKCFSTCHLIGLRKNM